MFVLTIPQQFAYLREISDTVDLYISDELYKQDFNIEHTESSILVQCYSIIVEELKSYGIHYIDLPYNGDFVLSTHIYLLYKFIKDLPNIITKDNVEYIKSIVENEQEDFITELVNQVNLAQYNHLRYISDNVYTNDTFRNYMSSIISSVENDTTYVDDTYINEQRDYLYQVQYLRETAAKYAAVLTNAYPDKVDNIYLSKLLRDYDKDKISADNLPIYARVDHPDITEVLKPIKDKYLLKHHLFSSHHIEYWLDSTKNPRPLPNFTDILMLVVSRAEPRISREQFTEDVSVLMSKAEVIFSKEYITLMSDMRDIILANAGEVL